MKLVFRLQIRKRQCKACIHIDYANYCRKFKMWAHLGETMCVEYKCKKSVTYLKRVG